MLATFGWREACIGWALIHLFLARPLNACLPRGALSNARRAPRQRTARRMQAWRSRCRHSSLPRMSITALKRSASRRDSGRSGGALSRVFPIWPTRDKARRPRAGPVVFSGAFDQAPRLRLRLSRQLSPLIPRMCAWCVSRSGMAPVRRSEPKTSVHSSKGRFDVMMIEPRSQRRETTPNGHSAPVLESGTNPSPLVVSRSRADSRF